jgi:hypothetical protein
MATTGDSIKNSKDTEALPDKPPQKKLRVRGPGDERTAKITIETKPSLSVMAGELRVANDCAEEGDATQLVRVEGTPLAVKTKDVAAA